MTKDRRFDWLAFLIGILFILVALISFYDPAGNLASIVIVFAIFAIGKGIFEILARNRMKELTGYKAIMPIVIGVIDILVGIFFFFNIGAGIVALPYIFAIWFILDSILALFTADLAKLFSTGYYWFTIVIGILGIVVGCLFFVNPITSALTLSFLVGLYLMLYGINEIIYAFR